MLQEIATPLLRLAMTVMIDGWCFCICDVVIVPGRREHCPRPTGLGVANLYNCIDWELSI